MEAETKVLNELSVVLPTVLNQTIKEYVVPALGTLLRKRHTRDFTPYCLAIYNNGIYATDSNMLLHIRKNETKEEEEEVPPLVWDTNELTSVCGVAVDDKENVFVANGNTVVVFHPHNEQTRRLGFGLLASAYGLAVDDQHLFVSDTFHHCVFKFRKETGELEKKWGSKGQKEQEFWSPKGLATDSSYLWVADYKNHRIQKYNKHTGEFLSAFGQFGKGPGQFTLPQSIAVNDKFLIIAQEGYRVQVLRKTTYSFVLEINYREDKPLRAFEAPDHLVIDLLNDHLWVSDAEDSALRCFAL
jgi:sugar lactone lactonase YvrE